MFVNFFPVRIFPLSGGIFPRGPFFVIMSLSLRSPSLSSYLHYSGAFPANCFVFVFVFCFEFPICVDYLEVREHISLTGADVVYTSAQQASTSYARALHAVTSSCTPRMWFPWLLAPSRMPVPLSVPDISRCPTVSDTCTSTQSQVRSCSALHPEGFRAVIKQFRWPLLSHYFFLPFSDPFSHPFCSSSIVLVIVSPGSAFLLGRRTRRLQ